MKIEIYKEIYKGETKYVVIHDGWVHVFKDMDEVSKFIQRTME